MSKNIGKRLFQLESGLIQSKKLRNEICWDRTIRLELSRCRDVVVGPGRQDDDSGETFKKNKKLKIQSGNFNCSPKFGFKS